MFIPFFFWCVSIHKRTIFMIWVKFGPHIYFDIFKIVSGTFDSFFFRRVDDYARYILYTLFFYSFALAGSIWRQKFGRN